jgi:alpha-tubulin suppressor-like RCC1 family protein
MKRCTIKLRTLFSTAAIICFNFIYLSAQTIAAGGNHSIFVCASGEAKVSGWNPNGQFGNGTTTGALTPITVNGLSGIVAVASRDEFTLYLLNDGTVWATGSNGSGQFGNGTTTSSNTLVQIPNLTGVTKIAAGFYHSLFLKSDSTVWACGRNFSGEVGDGTQTQRNTPVLVSSLSRVIDIAAGDNHSMFLLSDSTVWSCGANQNGSLGLGASPLQIINPTQVTSISGVKSIAGGFRHSLFVKHDGTAWASGFNNEGQVGNGTNVEAAIPVQVNNLTDIVSASAGQYHSLFLKSDGTAWGVGYNAMGQLGNGLNVSQNIPTQVSGLEGVIKVSASGYYHSLFLKDDNTFWACGQNNVGQLGNSGATDSNVPVQVLDGCSITTNLTKLNISDEVIIFPNPSNGFFNLEIRGNFSTDYNIEVYDFLGHLVYSNQLTTSIHNLDLSNEAKGIYFYKLSGGSNKITSGKIIID